ncbi:MAG: hypothetical protein Q8K05_05225, partial [Polaromonas sp.]|uniref:hypothetical protein n=1 Tax=Polaromonas sp. TaxID=1869339 RepID=UPI00273128E9
FLKGSGVLKLTGAVRQLEGELRALRASPAVGDVAMPVVAYFNPNRELLGQPLVRQEDALTQNFALAKQLSDAQGALATKEAEIAALTAERDHWRANHDAQVRRARLLIERQDIPVERVKAYEQVTALTAERDAAMAASRYETDLCGQALTDLKKMTVERDALRKDADRYDWISRQDLGRLDMGHIVDAAHDGEFYVVVRAGEFYGKTLGEAIDAAMTKEPGQ